MKSCIQVFIAGVMQGNRKDDQIYSQNYRQIITDKLSNFSSVNVNIVDPDKTDPDRLSYSFIQAKEMFIKYCLVAGKVNLLIAYIPEASMGSAIEMWTAYNAKIPIITISPMKNNWVVKILSTLIYPDIDEFCSKFSEKELTRLLESKQYYEI